MPDETQPLKEPAQRRAQRRPGCPAFYYHSRFWWWRVLGGQREDEDRHWLARPVEFSVLLLIVANVAMLMILASAPEDDPFEHAYYWFELASFVVFSLEYGFGFWSAVEDPRYAAPCRGRLRWCIQPLNALDLVCLVPFAVDLVVPLLSPTTNRSRYQGGNILRFLRLLRLFSLLRAERGLGSFALLYKVLKNKGEELLLTLYIACIILLMSSTLMFYAESDASHTAPSKRTRAPVCVD